MDRNGYSLCKGKIYWKIPESQFTSMYYSTVHDFIMESLVDPEVANVAANCVGSLSNLLSHPKCGLMRQLAIDFNLIEVRPKGFIFHIAAKRFVYHSELKKGITPRTFIRYKFKPNCVPFPRPFVQGSDLLSILKFSVHYLCVIMYLIQNTCFLSSWLSFKLLLSPQT